MEERDFSANFDPATRLWTMGWKWGDGREPGLLRNKMEGYAIPAAARVEYEAEVRQWIEEGWLRPYDENRSGPAKGLIPMMAVIQQNKDKVRPVLDFRELNCHIEAFTREADVCADKLREWRRRGVNVAMVDLKKAYLQIGVREDLWPYQTVRFQGQLYCLTRLGFGLNVAPLVMKAVLNCVLGQDERVRAGTSAYVDDIFVDEDVVSAEDVVSHLRSYGLESKPPERAKDGVRALGLHVWQHQGTLRWKRGGASVEESVDGPTRREVFSLCGRLVGHYPVCGWLRVAAGFVKRRASQATEKWDDVVRDPDITKWLKEIMSRVKDDDPVRGRWDARGDAVRLWVDASVLAFGAVVEMDGDVVEDASWLRKECASHINMAELDAVVKGLNLALTWKVRRVEVMTDSATVHRWIQDGLTGKSRLRTKAANEMLIRRRVGVVMDLVREYGLEMTIVLVPSADNKADALTRVPARWLKKGEVEPLVCAAAGDSLVDRVRAIHHDVGHPGVRRTLYFVRRKYPQASKQVAREVVRGCVECQSIDPAPEKWRKGSLEVERVWQRLAMDITHVGGQHFLTLIDCGPSRFAIWRSLRWQTTEAVVAQLEGVFLEHGPPEEILTDNDTAFRSRQFTTFADMWGVMLRFRAAHVPSGNGL
ncbi:MAG: DDE-type integrase/transposase/recombinase, partial [Pseudomonadota bacterium]